MYINDIFLQNNIDSMYIYKYMYINVNIQTCTFLRIEPDVSV